MLAKILIKLILVSKYTIFGLIVQCMVYTMLLASNSEAQDKSVEDINISISLEDVSIEEAFRRIEAETDFNFAYRGENIDKELRLHAENTNGSLGDFLRSIASQSNLSFKRVNRTIHVKANYGESKLLYEMVNLQEIAVSGTVTSSEDNMGLPGVNVLVKGTSMGTVTDVDGKYSIKVQDGSAILVFSSVGFLQEEISVGNRTVIDLVMTPDVTALEEIVVVGYGSTKKKDLTGSVASLDGEVMSELPNRSFEEGLQGRIAGVQVTQTSAEPGGGISVRVRGTNSLQASSEPLYVVDGFPILVSVSSAGNPGGIPLNPLSSINPNDIESVQVLKDASATAIYGSRGANGVVIITTKSGSSGKGVVEFQHFSSFSSVISEPIELANARQFAQYENDRQDALFDGVGKRYTSDYDATPEQIEQTYGEGTDWFDEILRTGYTQNYQLNFSGGTDAITYFISGNYLNEAGIVTGTGFARGGLRANVSARLSDKVSADLNVSYSRSVSDRTVTSSTNSSSTGVGANGGYATIVSVLKANPITKPTDPIDPFNPLTRLNFGGQLGDSRALTYNPLEEINRSELQNSTDLMLTNLDVAWKPWSFLKINFLGGATVRNEIRESFFPVNTSRGYQANGYGLFADIKVNDYLFENFATFTKDFSTSRLEVVAGYSYQQTTRWNNVMNGTDYAVQSLGINDFSQAAFNDRYNRNGSETTLLSFYGRASYNLLERYLFTFTGRYDGSSVFAENNKYAFFPSGAVAWRLSDEAFLQDNSTIDLLKLRASYGFSGNQAIGPYQSLAAFGIGGAGIDGRYPLGDGSIITGFIPQRPGNQNLRWEQTGQLNIGFDMGIVDNRYRLTLDYYKKRTEDLLQNAPLPAQSGYSFILDNVGIIENQGFEVDFGADILTKGAVTWSTTFNYSTNKSNVVKLADTDTLTIGASANGTIPTHVLIEGQEIGLFWGRPVVGLLSQEDLDGGHPTFNGNDHPGAFKYEDVDGNGIINGQDVRVIGNPNPDFILGWNNTLRYKNFDFTLFLQGVFGQDVLNVNKAQYEFGLNTYEGGVPTKEYLANMWTPQNTNTEFPTFQILPRDDMVSDRMIENGSYLRLRNIMVGYNLPASSVDWIQSMRVYVSGQNLLTWTEYSGFDPEVNNQGGAFGAPRLGVDVGAYPRARSVTLGINVGF